MKFLNGWSLTILLLAILPGIGFVSIELLQRHRYATMVAQLDASLRDLEADVRMECIDRLNLQLATGVSKHPIRLEREFRNYDSNPYRTSTWNLTASCDRHDPHHGLRMEFQVQQERRYILRSPRWTLHFNVKIPRSLEPLLQRALQGLDVHGSYFEY